MMNSKHRTVKTLLTTGAIFCLVPSLALAQPPAGGKGKGTRNNGQRGDQNGAMRGPIQMASRMIDEHDQDEDAELNATELTAALTARQKQRGAGKRQRDGQKSNAQRQRGGPGRERGASKGGQRSNSRRAGGRQAGNRRAGDNAGQRDAASRGGGDSAQIATRMITEFDKNGSAGLEVQELTASIKAQRERRGGKDDAAAGMRAGKGRRGGADRQRRPGKTDQLQTSQLRGPEQGRPGKGRGRAEMEDTEPGSGVVPKRPSE